jgi:predicted nucleic acid-binding protein
VLALDTSVAVAACLSPSGLDAFGDEDFVAPPLMWPETRSTLHLMGFRGEVSRDLAKAANERLDAVPVRAESPRLLGTRAWQFADELGWARTYDAEYIALASILGCRLVTLDARLHRGAARLGFVVSPAEL